MFCICSDLFPPQPQLLKDFHSQHLQPGFENPPRQFPLQPPGAIHRNGKGNIGQDWGKV